MKFLLSRHSDGGSVNTTKVFGYDDDLGDDEARALFASYQSSMSEMHKERWRIFEEARGLGSVGGHGNRSSELRNEFEGRVRSLGGDDLIRRLDEVESALDDLMNAGVPGLTRLHPSVVIEVPC